MPFGPRKTRTTGPYSKKLARGAIAYAYDGRSEEGRFIRDLEKQLIQHVGGDPSIAQKLLIDRIIKTRIQLDMLDQKLLGPEWTDHDRRTFGALQNSFQRCLRQLGMQPAPPPTPTLEEFIHQKRTRHEAAE